MRPLLHFSEDPNIRVFVPHCAKGKEQEPPRVWTIAEDYAPLYWFPRDCPRAAWWRLPTTTDEDANRWLGDSVASMILVIESAWVARLQVCQLYVYKFDPSPFEDIKDHGCHVAYETVAPLGPPEPVGDLLQRHASAGVELRITPSLWPLYDALIPTTLHWSFIRMRNALPRG